MTPACPGPDRGPVAADPGPVTSGSGPAAAAVECYSGHTYAAEPRAVTWQGQRRAVVRILRRWRAPQGPAFEVETEDGTRFALAFDETTVSWTTSMKPRSKGFSP